MKKFLFLGLFLCSSAFLFSQPLFTYGNEKVNGSEFIRAYNKNKTPVTDREQSLREYLDLYVNFKLKVRAAKDMKLDTLPQLQSDLDNFRQQIIENYVMDEEVTRKLMNEAFERSQKDLRITYFSIADGEDSAAAGILAAATVNKIRAGKLQYETIVNDLVESAHANAKYRDLGFLTVFSIAYPFENIVYSLKKGQVSEPFHYRKSWHIFKLEEERPAAGKWKTAQIMLALPPDSDPAVMASVQKKADSLYRLLREGADFAKLAKENSQDKMSFSNGGEMAEFGTGHYDPAFEKEVFSLAKDGDMTAPFRTGYGFHIVKRISRRPVPNDINDPMFSYEMKQQLMEDARMNASREKMTNDVLTRLAVKRVPALTDAELKQYVDSIIQNPDVTDDSRFAFSKKIILQYKGGSRKGIDWLTYARSQGINSETDLTALWKSFVSWAAMDHYRSHLEDYNEDFRFQIQEFKEGNMLFEAMERNVWGKAASDSTGLRGYYDQHKEKYKWAESADMLIVNTTAKDAAEFVMNLLKSGKNWRNMIEELEEVQADSGRYEISQISALNNKMPAEGEYTDPVENADGTFSFIRLIKKYPADQQRNFDDARGLVINDYQTVLEKKWIEELRRKYPVKVNEAVFTQLVKSK